MTKGAVVRAPGCQGNTCHRDTESQRNSISGSHHRTRHPSLRSVENVALASRPAVAGASRPAHKHAAGVDAASTVGLEGSATQLRRFHSYRWTASPHTTRNDKSYSIGERSAGLHAGRPAKPVWSGCARHTNQTGAPKGAGVSFCAVSQLEVPAELFPLLFPFLVVSRISMG